MHCAIGVPYQYLCKRALFLGCTSSPVGIPLRVDSRACDDPPG